MTLCLLLGSLPASAELTASVDTTELTTEQSVNFTLSTTTGSGNPDFSVLNEDFEILGQSTFSQTQNNNGKIVQNLSWRLQLLPKRAGTLVIPAITVAGESSNPVILAVSEPRVVTADDFGDFHIQVSVDTQNPYVQAQVIYTIRVYHAVNFLDGSLSSPETPGVVQVSLGDDRVFQENRNGRIYRVLERKLALFPQNSGSVTLPAVVLNAQVPAGRGNQGLFAPRQPVRRRSAEVVLEVQPRSSASAWWLPAKAVTIEAQWAGAAQAYFVGESVTRTIQLTAEGVDDTQLPQLAVPVAAQFRIYADQPELVKQAGRNGLLARRTETWAVVPQVAGELVLPAIEVPWFNTVTGRVATAVLPAATIQVQAARNAVTGETRVETPVAAIQTPEDTAEGSVAATMVQTSRAGNGAVDTGAHWKWIAMAAIALWLSTVLLWLWNRVRQRRRAQTADPVPAAASVSFAELERAGRQSDTHQFAAMLLKWAKGFWSENPPSSLVALARRVEIAGRSDEDASRYSLLADDLRALDALLYASGSKAQSSAPDTGRMVSVLRQLSDSGPKTRIDEKRSALPQL